MKRCAVIFCAAAVLAMPVIAMSAEAEPAPQKGRVVSETTAAANAVVKAIDMENRTVTLLLADGRERTFVVDKAVKKLGQVKVGDTVKARYHEAVSIKINKTKVAPETKVEAMVERDEKSVKPSGVAGLRVTTTATIEKIFDDGKMVTLRMPNGNTVDVQVRDKENLAKIKKGEVKEGDQIEITFTQALAISVEKVAQK
jgi:hypothetical protein